MGRDFKVNAKPILVKNKFSIFCIPPNHHFSGAANLRKI